MNDLHRVRRELRILKLWAGLSTVALAVLATAAFQEAPEVFDVIEVRRINLLNASGLPALVLAGQGRLPGPTAEGVEYSRELSGGRTRAAGMIFFNERGDEVGGLTYSGDLVEEGYRAYGGVTFDQFRQDQVVSLQYQDDGASRSAGVHVWDRSTDVTIAELLPLLEARRSGTDDERRAAEEAIGELAAGGLGAHRAFFGSRDGAALLELKDAEGRVRIRMVVDASGTPSVTLLDADGAVAHTWPG